MTLTLRRGLPAALAAALVAVALIATGPARVHASSSITEYPTAPGAGPTGIAYSDTDANLWLTEASNQLAVLDDHRGSSFGQVTQVPTLLQGPGNHIAFGPDGNMWFTELPPHDNLIGKVAPDRTVTEYATPYHAYGIVKAPDGSQNLYFTDPVANRIGRITTAGVATEPIAPLTANAGLRHITAGTDGKLYWTEETAGRIGRSDLAGISAEVALAADSRPMGIAGLPDGSVWFAEHGGTHPRVGKVDASLALTELDVPGAAPVALTLGGDGSVWFTDAAAPHQVWSVGLSATGPATPHDVPAHSALPLAISGGADYTLWFTEQDTNRVGEFGVAFVSAITPVLGPAQGGTQVTITGTQFTGATEVNFGAAHVACPSAGCTVNSDGQISVTTPATQVGTVDVTVRTPFNSSPAVPADRFTFYPPGGNYVPVTPYRVLDTRGGFRPGPNATMDVQVSGTGSVPASGVQAVAVNVTVANATAGSYLTVYPTGASTRPTASNLNFGPSQQIANLVVAGLGNAGKLTVYNSQGSVDVIMDVQGYVTATPSGQAGLFKPLSGGPRRVLDTRNGTGGFTQPIGPNAAIGLQLGGTGDVPQPGASAVVLNVTAVNGTAPSYLSVYPEGAAGVFSNLNFPAGRNLPNRVMVKLGNGGRVSFYNSEGRVDVVADLVGYFTDAGASGGAYFHAQPPVRILDTRPGSQVGPYNTPFAPNQVRALSSAGQAGVPLTGTVAVVANVTVTNPDSSSFLTVFPGDSGTPPNASDLNFSAADTLPNLVVVKVSAADGTIKIYNNLGNVDVLADLSGWYGPA